MGDKTKVIEDKKVFVDEFCIDKKTKKIQSNNETNVRVYECVSKLDNLTYAVKFQIFSRDNSEEIESLNK